MGYESRIYIVEKHHQSYYDDNKRYATQIARIDMSKCYALSDILRYKPRTDCYIYSDDGNTRILEDCYGKPLTETPIHEAIRIVEEAIEKTPWEYWKYNVLLATLQSVYDFVGKDEDFVVLHYGY